MPQVTRNLDNALEESQQIKTMANGDVISTKTQFNMEAASSLDTAFNPKSAALAHISCTQQNMWRAA
jgi:hypothetical protein